MNIKTVLLSIIAGTSANLFSMETTFTPSSAPSTKEASILWLKTKIQPINAGRFRNPNNPGAQANCTFCAEECVKVLSGIKEPEQVPAKKKNFDITYRPDDSGTIIYHEALRQEQADLIPFKEFTETIDLLEDKPTSSIDLNKTVTPTSLKYITSSRNTIINDIKSLAGSAVSHGNDKTLAGLVYYYYKNRDNAGHLANFYRDKDGNIFFVDAQNEEITETPPTKILIYDIADTMFFYPMTPKGGYYIKRETLMPVKEEKKVHEKPEIIEEKRASKKQKTSQEKKTYIIEEEKPFDIVTRNAKKNNIPVDETLEKLWQAFLKKDQTTTCNLIANGANPLPILLYIKSRYSPTYLKYHRDKLDSDQIFINIYSYKDPQLLLYAAKFNNLALADKVFKSWDNKLEELKKLDLRDQNGNNPLMIAIINKNADMVQLLNTVFPFNGTHKNNDGFTDLKLRLHHGLANLVVTVAPLAKEQKKTLPESLLTKRVPTPQLQNENLKEIDGAPLPEETQYQQYCQDLLNAYEKSDLNAHKLALKNLFHLPNFSKLINDVSSNSQQHGSRLLHQLAEIKDFFSFVSLILGEADIKIKNNLHKTPFDYLTFNEKLLVIDWLHYAYIISTRVDKSNLITCYYALVDSVFEELGAISQETAYKCIHDIQYKNRFINIITNPDNQGLTYLDKAAQTQNETIYKPLGHIAKTLNIGSDAIKKSLGYFKETTLKQRFNYLLLPIHAVEPEYITNDQAQLLLKNTVDDLKINTTMVNDIKLHFNFGEIKIIKFYNQCLKLIAPIGLKHITDLPIQDNQAKTILHILAQRGLSGTLQYLEAVQGAALTTAKDENGKTYLQYLKEYVKTYMRRKNHED